MKVLLAIDSSQASQGIICEVIGRPWPSGTKFCVLHIVDIASLGRFAAVVDQQKAAGQALVVAVAEKLTHAGLETCSEVLIAFPRKTAVQYAKEWDADLIMVASHGQGAIARFLVGSVAQAVLRAAPCSVEIVRRKVNGLAPLGRRMKILIATDGSETAAVAAKSVASRPWPVGSEIKIISVAELVLAGQEIINSSSSPIYPISLLEQIWSDSREHAREAVAQVRTILEATKMRIVQEEPVPEGDPRVILLKQAKEWDADLIVLGSHGRRGLDRLLMGSVSEAIALHAQCSVEIIRGK
jgi:nucleotide-binding universal stress UspA family protein